MKMNHRVGLMLIIVLVTGCQSGGQRQGALIYEPDENYPFGRPNPDAPDELQQFAFIIGQNNCSEERLNNASGEWEPGTRTWDGYYFINGNAIRDSGRSGNATNGNIRVFDEATNQWHVTYISTPVFGTGVWSGGMVEDRIELEQPQKAPGTEIDGINRLTFFDITDDGFQWKGEWTSLDGSLVFPYWRIQCSKLR